MPQCFTSTLCFFWTFVNKATYCYCHQVIDFTCLMRRILIFIIKIICNITTFIAFFFCFLWNNGIRSNVGTRIIYGIGIITFILFYLYINFIYIVTLRGVLSSLLITFYMVITDLLLVIFVIFFKSITLFKRGFYMKSLKKNVILCFSVYKWQKQLCKIIFLDWRTKTGKGKLEKM